MLMFICKPFRIVLQFNLTPSTPENTFHKIKLAQVILNVSESLLNIFGAWISLKKKKEKSLKKKKEKGLNFVF